MSLRFTHCVFAATMVCDKAIPTEIPLLYGGVERFPGRSRFFLAETPTFHKVSCEVCQPALCTTHA